MTDKPENPFVYPMSSKDKQVNMATGLNAPMAGSTAPNLGMTLRDYFAGQALAGELVSISALPISKDETAVEHFARGAYSLADAMLKERAK